MQNLCTTLSRNYSLTTLILAKNDLDYGNMDLIGTLLKYDQSITHLDLSGNQIHCVGVASLTEGLKANTTLLTFMYAHYIFVFRETACQIGCMMLEFKRQGHKLWALAWQSLIEE